MEYKYEGNILEDFEMIKEGTFNWDKYNIVVYITDSVSIAKFNSTENQIYYLGNTNNKDNYIYIPYWDYKSKSNVYLKIPKKKLVLISE